MSTIIEIVSSSQPTSVPVDGFVGLPAGGVVGQTIIKTSSNPYDVHWGAGGDKHFEYDQNTASPVWVITHNLNNYPSVTIVDSAGNEVEGDIQYTSNNVVTVTFSAGFAGKAYLN